MKSRYLIFALVVALFLLFPSLMFGWGPYGYAPPPVFGPAPSAAGLRIERGADAENYYLDIHLAGIQPQAVAIKVLNGRWLAVSTEASDRQSHQGSTPDNLGYTRSFSYSSSHQGRRIRLPPDADPTAMQREDLEDGIRITLPRVAPAR